MQLRQLEYFRAVAKAGAFTRAAEQVRISQSALSRQIALLEADLGVTLLERHGRGVLLTEEGNILLQQAEGLMRQAAGIRDAVREASTSPSGSLGLGIPRSMRALLTLPALAAFLRHYPDVFIRFSEDVSSVIREKLLRAELDLGLLSSQEPASVLDCSPLLQEQMFLVGPTGAGFALEVPIEIDAMARLPLILPPAPTSLRTAAERVALRNGFSLAIRAEVNASLILDLVSEGLGHAVYSYCGIHDALAQGRISAAPISGFTIEWMLAQSRERPKTRAGDLMAEMIEQQVRHAVASGLWQAARVTGHAPPAA